MSKRILVQARERKYASGDTKQKAECPFCEHENIAILKDNQIIVIDHCNHYVIYGTESNKVCYFKFKGDSNDFEAEKRLQGKYRILLVD